MPHSEDEHKLLPSPRHFLKIDFTHKSKNEEYIIPLVEKTKFYRGHLGVMHIFAMHFLGLRSSLS